VWSNWTQGYTYTTPTSVTVTYTTTEAEVRYAQARRDDLQYAEDRRERDRVTREVASARGRELLQMVLAADEWETVYDVEPRPWFEGSDGYMYHLREGLVGNVVQFHPGADDPTSGRRIVRLCAHPDDRVRMPGEDYHVGQILALKTDAPLFLGHGNVNQIYDDTEYRKQTEVWRERLRAFREENGLVRRPLAQMAA
jgi:hypothetical protein